MLFLQRYGLRAAFPCSRAVGVGLRIRMVLGLYGYLLLIAPCHFFSAIYVRDV